MRTYLLTFTKSIPVFAGWPVYIAITEEPWHTTIGAKNIEEAELTAKTLGTFLRGKLTKGYDIALDSVELVG